MGTRRLRTVWTFGSLAVFFLQCSLTSSEAPVTNYMSNYYDDAYHESPSKTKTSSPSKSHPTHAYSRGSYHHGPETDTEEHHDEEEHHPQSQKPHTHHDRETRPHHPPPSKHHHHDDDDHHDEPHDPRPKSPVYRGTYNSKPPSYGNSPKPHTGKSYDRPPSKTNYRSTTTGIPKYITTSGPSFTSASSSRAPFNKVPVGSSYSSQTGPGYSYSYGTKITEEMDEAEHEDPREHRPYDESPPKSSYNMDRANTYKGSEDYKAGYTPGYPPINPYNTVKGTYDDYGHNDLSPKSPYKPSYKPITFSYSSSPSGSDYGTPIEEGPSYDIDDPSYSNTYDKNNYGSPKSNNNNKHKPPPGGKPTSSFFPNKQQGKPKPSYSSPPPKFHGPPTKHHHGPLSKNYGAMKSYSGPPSNTYSTLSAKTYGKNELYHGPPKGYYAPSNGYGPPTGSSSGSSNKDSYDSPSYGTPDYSRGPSTSSPMKERERGPPPPRGYNPRGSSSPPPPSSRGNPMSNIRGSPGRGKRRPNNAYRYSYTAFTMFNKKRPGRGHRQGAKGHYGHTHGLAPKPTIGYYDGMDDDYDKREQDVQKNKRLFGSVGYSLGDSRTFVKTPEASSSGYSNAATYGGGYDMGTSYY